MVSLHLGVLSNFETTKLSSPPPGVLTTPQLHYMVRSINTQGAFGAPTEEEYYMKMVTAFNQLLPKVRSYSFWPVPDKKVFYWWVHYYL